MSNQIWSWVVTIIGVIGFWLAGRKVWWCWYVNIANQILWVVFAVVTRQWGFLVGVPLYLTVFGRNAVVWTKQHYSPSRRLMEATKSMYPDRREDSDIISFLESENLRMLSEEVEIAERTPVIDESRKYPYLSDPKVTIRKEILEDLAKRVKQYEKDIGLDGQ